MRILQARTLGGLPWPPPGDLPNPGIKPRSPILQMDSLPSEPPRKPMNTGVGNLSLLQVIFLTQELIRGLLHCRRVLYQLSYQGSPYWSIASLQHCANFCCAAKWLSNTHIVILFKYFFHYGLSQDIVVAKGGEGDDRGWDSWMASLTRWTWVWVNSRSWWWTGRPGVLPFMGSQSVGHDWATELNWWYILN